MEVSDVGRLDNVRHEMTTLKIIILGVCQTKWQNNGDFVTDKHRIYAGGKKNDEGLE